MGGRSPYNSRLLHLLEYTVTSPRHRQPFLVFLYRLVRNSSEERQRLGPMMDGEDCGTIQCRSGSSFPSGIIAACTVDIVDHQDFKTLLSMQSEHGS